MATALLVVAGLLLHSLVKLATVESGFDLATAVTRSLSGLLFERTPLDIRTNGLVAVSFAAVSLAASYLAARRATRADPLATLRCE